MKQQIIIFCSVFCRTFLWRDVIQIEFNSTYITIFPAVAPTYWKILGEKEASILHNFFKNNFYIALEMEGGIIQKYVEVCRLYIYSVKQSEGTNRILNMHTNSRKKIYITIVKSLMGGIFPYTYYTLRATDSFTCFSLEHWEEER